MKTKYVLDKPPVQLPQEYARDFLLCHTFEDILRIARMMLFEFKKKNPHSLIAYANIPIIETPYSSAIEKRSKTYTISPDAQAMIRKLQGRNLSDILQIAKAQNEQNKLIDAYSDNPAVAIFYSQLMMGRACELMTKWMLTESLKLRNIVSEIKFHEQCFGAHEELFGPLLQTKNTEGKLLIDLMISPRNQIMSRMPIWIQDRGRCLKFGMIDLA